jgi:SAM-dependent methyltransferase
MDYQTDHNAKVWKKLYAEGKNDLVYPNDSFVRIFSRLFSGAAQPLHILDYGFGTGANLIHLARRGHKTAGVEISADALAITQKRLEALGLTGDLSLTTPGARLDFPDGHFDVVVSWQVIYYNDWKGLHAIVKEFERVTRSGGTIIIAMAAPGDVSQIMADRAAEGVYISRVPGQEGCVLVIPEREKLPSIFKGRNLEIGEFHFAYQGTVSRHWVITYVVD